VNTEILADGDAVAKRAADIIAHEIREAVAARGRCVIAVSGGQTPWIMLRRLAAKNVPWSGLHVFQVDERVAPTDSPDRNLTHLRESLLDNAPMKPERIYAMPVDNQDLQGAARDYASTLRSVAGHPPILDLVHLGLGPDGHTASLVPDDPALDEGDADVAVSGVYQGHRRLTLTYPILGRARRILWVVTGEEKAAALVRLRAGDTLLPAGRVARGHAVVLADRASVGSSKLFLREITGYSRQE
jgi:6-phosphogluconolactonase